MVLQSSSALQCPASGNVCWPLADKSHHPQYHQATLWLAWSYSVKGACPMVICMKSTQGTVTLHD